MELKVRNVNEGLYEGLNWLKVAGVKESSRNGPVLVSPEPVMTVYGQPRERVLFSPMRGANPFFHLFEALWMLAGREDIGFIAQFAKNMLNYSDDGVTQHGAYGYRWRHWFGYDQLPFIAQELRKNQHSRRCVLTMWDGEHDLDYALTPGTKDAPCNTHIYFDGREGYLNMTVLCRSNDIWWGCYGANAVHFSILQEYLAKWSGYAVGVYRQFSNNFHIYTDVVPLESFDEYAADARCYNLYNLATADVRTFPLIDKENSIGAWDAELKLFLKDPLREGPWDDPFFGHVAVPMYRAWHTRKMKKGIGLAEASLIKADDWRRGVELWIAKREEEKREREGAVVRRNA